MSDDDEPIAAALPVTARSVDRTRPPANGDDYLMLVRLEAAAMPSIMRAERLEKSSLPIRQHPDLAHVSLSRFISLSCNTIVC